MDNITLSLAILLGVGFMAAKLVQVLRLPSVTGYIMAGLLLGPSGLHFVTLEAISSRLGHFSQIALMLIAFGIGEHLELPKLRRNAKTVGFVGLGETSLAFVMVGLSCFFVARIVGVGPPSWGFSDYLALSILLGAVCVATAPAATLHVMRELRAVGPLTSTLMAVVAVDDGLAIMYFGVAMSAARHIMGGGGSLAIAVLSSLYEILFSLALGAVVGWLMDLFVHKLRRRGEMLTMGLALLLLCGETARMMHLSPLLAGMAAGFTIVNRDRRDVRIFRSINAFEPPIYVLFFTLAGAHLEMHALVAAGWVGLAYFLMRVAGKISGAYVGGRLARAPHVVRRYLGLALVPQAGVAIGLIFLIQTDPALDGYAKVITPVVLGGVVLSELLGPICARLAVTWAGETEFSQDVIQQPDKILERESGRDCLLVPWTWPKLDPPEESRGRVAFGVSSPVTVAGLSRMAALMANNYQAELLAVAVHTGTKEPDREKADNLFQLAGKEVSSMGFCLETMQVSNPSVAAGILSASDHIPLKAILLGHPIGHTERAFQKIVEAVARDAPCPVVVVRLVGELHTESILAPISDREELQVVGEVIQALARIGKHRITLLHLLPSDALDEEVEEAEDWINEWSRDHGLAASVLPRVQPTEARQETIVQESLRHNLVVMPAGESQVLQRLFFGSLARDVASRCRRPMLIVHRPVKHGVKSALDS